MNKVFSDPNCPVCGLSYAAAEVSGRPLANGGGTCYDHLVWHFNAELQELIQATAIYDHNGYQCMDCDDYCGKSFKLSRCDDDCEQIDTNLFPLQILRLTV